MEPNDDHNYTVSEFCMRFNTTETQLMQLSIYQLQQRFRLDYKTAAFISHKLQQGTQKPPAVFAGLPLGKYLSGTRITEISAQTPTLIDKLLKAFLKHNAKGEVLLFQQLPATVQKLQTLSNAYLERINIFNLNQYSLYGNLELVYAKAEEKAIVLIVFDSIFQQLQNHHQFNALLLRLSYSAPVICFNYLMEYPFERGEQPAFVAASDSRILTSISGLSRYYVEQAATAKQFGVIRLNKLVSPAYNGKCQHFGMRVIDFEQKFYVWDGGAQMWTVDYEVNQ